MTNFDWRGIKFNIKKLKPKFDSLKKKKINPLEANPFQTNPTNWDSRSNSKLITLLALFKFGWTKIFKCGFVKIANPNHCFVWIDFITVWGGGTALLFP